MASLRSTPRYEAQTSRLPKGWNTPFAKSHLIKYRKCRGWRPCEARRGYEAQTSREQNKRSNSFSKSRPIKMKSVRDGVPDIP